LDKQKEWVGVWKIALFFLLGAEFGLIGFIFNNFDKLSELKHCFFNNVFNSIICFNNCNCHLFEKRNRQIGGYQ